MATRRKIVSLAGAILVTVSPHVVHADQSCDWSTWSTLAEFKPMDETLRAARKGRNLPRVNYVIQDIRKAGGANVNFDDFAIVVEALPTSGPTTPEALLSHLRVNLASLFDGDIATFHTFSPSRFIRPDHDDDAWRTDGVAPIGALMNFGIGLRTRIGSFRGVEQAAVIVSRADATSWTFSTVKIGFHNPGEHPVSGNRQFGIRTLGDGRFEIYTRGADRTVDNTRGWFYRMSLLPSEQLMFSEADALWTSFQNKVKAEIEKLGGTATVKAPTTCRPSWERVKKSLVN